MTVKKKFKKTYTVYIARVKQKTVQSKSLLRFINGNSDLVSAVSVFHTVLLSMENLLINNNFKKYFNLLCEANFEPIVFVF